MDYTDYTSAKVALAGPSGPSLCALFKYLSIETWKRMEFAYSQKGMRIWETTITQNLIFTLNAYKHQYKLPIVIQESEDEKTNGSDIELVLIYRQLGLAFYAPMQAKKLYKSDSYQAMEHNGQTQKLINYAKKRNGYPLYLLYNYHDPKDADITTQIRNQVGGVGLNGKAIQAKVANIEKYGCSVLSADYIYNTYYLNNHWIVNPKFLNLHSFNFGLPLGATNSAMPWENLVCAPAFVPGFQDVHLLKYGDDVDVWLNENRGWLNRHHGGLLNLPRSPEPFPRGIRELTSITNDGWLAFGHSKTKPQKGAKTDNHDAANDFRPMYRIMFTIESI